ncbi:MAG: Fe2+-dependent dioxygenase [Aphanocapsa feldmannii 288cV]|nr:MAG: Fe2+-dependent dioxygenase [Aphanocapsa feldmannii 288cV]
MSFCLEPLLTREKVKAIQTAVESADWQNGIGTAGWHARTVKRNLQLRRDAEPGQRLAKDVKQALLANPLLKAAALPKHIHGILFSRTENGGHYGRHVDEARMQGGRTDLSFTLFLQEPDHYAGGELVVETAFGDQRFKLPAGHAVVYPSGSLHWVEPVTTGSRLVCVGWIESLVRDPAKREVLFDLDAAARSLFARGGRMAEFDLVSKCHANLKRMWSG